MSAILGSVIFSARIPLPLVCSCRKKAKNFYVAGRRLTRLYFAGYGRFVSAFLGGVGAFGSGSPTVGLLLPEKGKELLCRGTALDAPLLCGIRRICVRGFWQCRGFWLGLPLPLACSCRKKAKNFYVAGRRLARLYFAGYGRFVSAILGSVGGFWVGLSYRWLVLERKKAENFYVAGRHLNAPLLCGIRQVCVRVFGQCRGFWVGLSYRWPALAGKTKKARRAICFPSYTAWPHGEAASCQGILFPVYWGKHPKGATVMDTVFRVATAGTRPPSAGCLWRCCGPFSTPRR